jgi:hypothetical protein
MRCFGKIVVVAVGVLAAAQITWFATAGGGGKTFQQEPVPFVHFKDRLLETAPTRMGSVRFHLPGGVTAVAYSPDGKLIAAAGPGDKFSTSKVFLVPVPIPHYNTPPVNRIRTRNANMLRLINRSCLALTLSLILLPAARAQESPTVLLQDSPVGIVLRADGSFAYFNRKAPAQPVTLKTTDGKPVALEPTIAAPKVPGTLFLQDKDGRLHQITTKLRGPGKKIAVDRFIDLWHHATDDNGQWSEPEMIWKGYIGALMEYRQLSTGRIVAPFGSWLPNIPTAPPTGPNVVTLIYSDDGGKTWLESPAKLTAPCYEGYNGSNYGACEPVLVEMKDRRLYMLMRTQAGFLYESWSNDDGKNWSKAVASRFHSSTGPPGLLKLADGRLVLFWNNCEMPPRIDGQGVYGGRDALHAAISADGGKTWRGFCEVYRDPFRDKTPPKSGDRGTAYPFGTYDRDGNILVLSGQGGVRRNFVKFHPDWLTLTTKDDDFKNGLDGWHTFKPFGPAAGYWRDRTAGPVLIDHPVKPGAKVLHLRKPDDKDADGATWNFPLGWKGEMTVKFLIKPGYHGCSIALGDRFFEPTDDNGERLAMFRLDVLPNGALPHNKQKSGVATNYHHTLKLKWDLTAKKCEVDVNGTIFDPLPLANETGNGLCYLRLRSSAKDIDAEGIIVESVRVMIDDPVAPPRTVEQNQEIEAAYIKAMEGFRNKAMKK